MSKLLWCLLRLHFLQCVRFTNTKMTTAVVNWFMTAASEQKMSNLTIIQTEDGTATATSASTTFDTYYTNGHEGENVDESKLQVSYSRNTKSWTRRIRKGVRNLCIDAPDLQHHITSMFSPRLVRSIDKILNASTYYDRTYPAVIVEFMFRTVYGHVFHHHFFVISCCFSLLIAYDR